MKRLGSADFGVSTSLYDELLLSEVLGGGGLAKGFFGPVGPALSIALALGDCGGGRCFMTLCPESRIDLAGGFFVFGPVGSTGDALPVTLPASDCSLGI